MRRAERLVLAALAAFGFAGPASAGCSISTVGVAFGTYDPRAAAPLDGAGSVTTVCDAANVGHLVSVTVDAGVAGNISARAMSSGASTLQYQLYSNAARTIIWGAAGLGVSYDGRKTSITRAIYGRIPARQNVRSGSYADTLTVTIAF